VIFPPGAIPVAILLNGSPLQTYNRPYLSGGRIRAPIAPYVTRIADRIALERGALLVTRGGQTFRIRTGAFDPQSLPRVYVEVVPLHRRFGARVVYDSQRHVLDVQLPRRRDVLPGAPLQSAQPHVTPTRVFTPEPLITPRPAYTGTPHPRRTPIVVTTSRPQ